jgi:hypothetical protein
VTVLGRLFERRASIESPTVPLSSSGILEMLGMQPNNATGVAVTEKSALRFGAVWRAVNLISGLVARCRCTRTARAPTSGNGADPEQPAPGLDAAGVLAAAVRAPGSVGQLLRA